MKKLLSLLRSAEFIFSFALRGFVRFFFLLVDFASLVSDSRNEDYHHPYHHHHHHQQ